MKQNMFTLFAPLLAALLFNAACSSDDSSPDTPTPTPPTPQPTSYDIYVAGYKTVSSKAVATVWKNGEELYALTDGTTNAWAYALCVVDGTVYTAGYEEQQGHIVACLWENGSLKYTLGAAGSNSYAMAVAAAGSDVYAAGSTTVDGSLTATVWKNGTVLYIFGFAGHVAGPCPAGVGFGALRRRESADGRHAAGGPDLAGSRCLPDLDRRHHPG